MNLRLDTDCGNVGNSPRCSHIPALTRTSTPLYECMEHSHLQALIMFQLSSEWHVARGKHDRLTYGHSLTYTSISLTTSTRPYTRYIMQLAAQCVLYLSAPTARSSQSYMDSPFFSLSSSFLLLTSSFVTRIGGIFHPPGHFFAFSPSGHCQAPSSLMPG